MGYREKVRQRLITFLKDEEYKLLDLSKEIGIAHVTLMRYVDDASRASLNTAIKIDAFLDRKEEDAKQ